MDGPPSPSDLLGLADDVEAMLRRDVLARWFPAAVDPRGGFHQHFGQDWARLDRGDARMVVYQARLTWTAAAAAARFPDLAGECLAINRHGLAFLRDRQWDGARGGFFWSVDPGGRPAGHWSAEKHAYGIAFGIYAAAASFAVTRDPAALALARAAFEWLHRGAHDGANGGYAEALAPDGAPLPAGRSGFDAIGTSYGLKSANTHIHLLEAFSALAAAAADPAARAGLQEIFDVVRDRIYAEPGALAPLFLPDWRRVPGAESYGHNLETAYLLADAARVLGCPDDAGTWRIARSLVDRALALGFDEAHGGFFHEGSHHGRNADTTKLWWVQAEGLNALLLMHARHGGATPLYWQAFLRTWAFIATRQRDHANGGWHPAVSADGTPLGRAKSGSWTDPYHQARALLNVSATLRRLAAATAD